MARLPSQRGEFCYRRDRVASISNAVNPRNLRTSVSTNLLCQTCAVFQHCGRDPTPDVKCLADSTIIMSHKPVRLYYILHMHVVSLEKAVLKCDRRLVFK